jgi:hypothetical protein
MEICVIYADNRHVDNVDTLFRTMRESNARIIVHEKSVERVGILQSIEREDGSGKSFNVTVYLDGESRTFYVRENPPESYPVGREFDYHNKT